MRESGRAEQITATIIETARQCNLDKDVALPADDEGVKSLTMEERDLVIGNVYRCVRGGCQVRGLVDSFLGVVMLEQQRMTGSTPPWLTPGVPCPCLLVGLTSQLLTLPSRICCCCCCCPLAGS
jgi:hypothetical protein